MSTATVTYALARLSTESAPSPRSGQVGRIYVLDTDAVAAALTELGTQASVVAREGLRSHVVRGTTRPAGRLRRLIGRPRHFACGDVERTELSLDTGTALIDHEIGTDRVIVRTWAPRDGSELDHALWWHGHRVLARG